MQVTIILAILISELNNLEGYWVALNLTSRVHHVTGAVIGWWCDVTRTRIFCTQEPGSAGPGTSLILIHPGEDLAIHYYLLLVYLSIVI